MPQPVRKPATYQDVLDAPEHMVAQIIHGVLHTHPRPAMPHAVAASFVGGELMGPFGRGKGGPGGWIILDEPELHLGDDIVVPDLGGWRRETMPVIPDAAFVTVAPDWVCEVASPSTRALDRGQKLDIYRREGVSHVWIIEPLDQLIEVLELDGDSYRIVQTVVGEAPSRLKPFDAIEFDVGALWTR